MMTATMTRTQKPAKPQTRTLRILARNARKIPSSLALTTGKLTVTYTVIVYAISPECGQYGVEFEKSDGESYDVLVPHSGKPVCECMGYLAHDHCKHSACVSKLIAMKELPSK